METIWRFFYELSWFEIAFVAVFLSGFVPLVVNEILHLAANYKIALALVRNRPVIALVRVLDTIVGMVLCAPGSGYLNLRESIIKSFENK